MKPIAQAGRMRAGALVDGVSVDMHIPGRHIVAIEWDALDDDCKSPAANDA